MCNRVATPNEDEAKGYFDKMDPDLSALFKVEPFTHYFHTSSFVTPMVPFVGNDDPLCIRPAMWTFIPENGKFDTFKKYSTENARAEEIFDKQLYKRHILPKRGLVVLKGFYEGQEQADKTSQPYFIYPANHEILTLGCIYSDWLDDRDGVAKRTFTILTTEANELMAAIHNKKKRMPLIVSPEKRLWWLSPELTKEELLNYFIPYPDGYLAAHKVTRNIYKRGYDTNTPEIQQEIS